MKKDRKNSFLSRQVLIFCTVLLLFVGRSWGICAQEESTSNLASDVISTETTLSELPLLETDGTTLSQYPTLKNVLGTSPLWRPNSTMALLCAIIPGGGQLYNRKYWKIPLVLGATTACLYAITWNGRLYNEYHTAYVDFMNPNPLEKDSWKGFIPQGADPKNYVGDANIQNRLKKGSELYRRNRDLSIIVSAAVYLLSFIDAYVDAELFDFEVSPNLSLVLAPATTSFYPEKAGFLPAVSCSLNF